MTVVLHCDTNQKITRMKDELTCGERLTFFTMTSNPAKLFYLVCWNEIAVGEEYSLVPYHTNPTIESIARTGPFL